MMRKAIKEHKISTGNPVAVVIFSALSLHSFSHPSSTIIKRDAPDEATPAGSVCFMACSFDSPPTPTTTTTSS